MPLVRVLFPVCVCVRECAVSLLRCFLLFSPVPLPLLLRRVFCLCELFSNCQSRHRFLGGGQDFPKI